MLFKTSNYLTNYFIENHIVSPQNKEIFIYGFQLILSTLSSMFTILLISAVFNISYGIIFLLFFMPIRFCAGGFHASTYHKCFVYTNGVFITMLIFSKIVYMYNLLPYYFLLIIASILHLWINTPCKNNKNPLSDIYIRKNKILSRKILVLYFVIILLTYYLERYLFILEINTIFLVSILFICGDFEYIKS